MSLKHATANADVEDSSDLDQLLCFNVQLNLSRRAPSFLSPLKYGGRDGNTNP